MPSSVIHRKLTAWVLSTAPELFVGTDTTALQMIYCCYPDFALTGDMEARRFLFEHDGLPFHYLPDAPLENIYRYYSREADGTLRRSCPFVNPHYEFALAGMKHYLELILQFLQEDCVADAMKATGTLLHILQDNSFGIHTLEGPGGTDVFFFDHLKLWSESPFQTLARLDCGDEIPTGLRTPLILGNSVDEAALRIYRHWCDAIRTGRSICVKSLIDHNTDIAPMTSASILLCADVLHTLHALAHHQRAERQDLPLEELEPYEPPSRGMAKLQDETLSFPVSAEEHLLYLFPAGVFGALSMKLTAMDESNVHYELINDGKVTECGDLNAGTVVDLSIAFPKNQCGLKFYADHGTNTVILKHPVLQRQS